jgi:hypothetical protein
MVFYFYRCSLDIVDPAPIDKQNSDGNDAIDAQHTILTILTHVLEYLHLQEDMPENSDNIPTWTITLLLENLINAMVGHGLGQLPIQVGTRMQQLQPSNTENSPESSMTSSDTFNTHTAHNTNINTEASYDARNNGRDMNNSEATCCENLNTETTCSGDIVTEATCGEDLDTEATDSSTDYESASHNITDNISVSSCSTKETELSDDATNVSERTTDTGHRTYLANTCYTVEVTYTVVGEKYCQKCTRNATNELFASQQVKFTGQEQSAGINNAVNQEMDSIQQLLLGIFVFILVVTILYLWHGAHHDKN